MNVFCFDTYRKMLDNQQKSQFEFRDPFMDRDLFFLLQRIYIYLSFRKETQALVSEVSFPVSRCL